MYKADSMQYKNNLYPIAQLYQSSETFWKTITIDSQNIAVQYNMILHTARQLRMLNFDPTPNPRTIPIIRPDGRAMGVFLRKMYDKCDVIYEIIRLLELSLLHNDFLFNDQWFLTTMWTKK